MVYEHESGRAMPVISGAFRNFGAERYDAGPYGRR